MKHTDWNAYSRELLREVEHAYAAGYIDGEGCITVSGRQCRVMISNTYPYTLHWLKSLFGGTVKSKKDSTRKRNHRSAYYWSISGVDAEDMLTLCMPFMQEKFVQAKTAIEYCNTDGLDERKKLSARMSRLKKVDHGGR